MKILFVINNMKIGGTRKSLLNLLSKLENKNIEVDLLIFNHAGEYINSIPKYVHVIEENRKLSYMFSEYTQVVSNKKYLDLFGKVGMTLGRKIFGTKKFIPYVFRTIIKNLELKNEVYNVVIGYQEGLINDFAALVPSDKSIIWIHNNFENFKGTDKGLDSTFERVKYIFFVANASKDNFVENKSQYNEKVRLVKNLLPQEEVRKSANSSEESLFKVESQGFNLVSMGRFVPQKAFHRIIGVAKALKTADIKFQWIIIGDGPLFDDIKKLISRNELEEYVFLCGSKKNPYPIICKADLFVMSSIYESQPISLMEALTLSVPVITTEFPSAIELIGHNNYGLIIKNSEESLKEELLSLLSEENRILEMKKSAKDYIYDNESVLNEFIGYLEK